MLTRRAAAKGLSATALALASGCATSGYSYPSRQREIPLTDANVVKAVSWLHTNFGEQMSRALPEEIPLAFAYAVVCQETAIAWVKPHPQARPGFRDSAPIDRLSPEIILKRCVFDTSGDELIPGTNTPRRTRDVFPRNRAEFTARHGESAAEFLVNEGSMMRREFHGWDPSGWLYKGYGLFQFDLQHAQEGQLAFFMERQWYQLDACLTHFISEMRPRVINNNGDLLAAAASYNGSLRGAPGSRRFTNWYGPNVVEHFLPRCNDALAAMT